MNNETVQSGNVVIPNNHPNPPEKHEIEAAQILSRHYGCTITFIIPIEGYGVKTADFEMMGNLYEIKSPEGKSKKSTIKNQFDNAKGKLTYLIIDGRRIKILDDDAVISQIRFELKNHRSVKRLIYITKDGKVLEIKK